MLPEQRPIAPITDEEANLENYVGFQEDVTDQVERV